MELSGSLVGEAENQRKTHLSFPGKLFLIKQDSPKRNSALRHWFPPALKKE
jgi:hypothetical protein